MTNKRIEESSNLPKVSTDLEYYKTGILTLPDGQKIDTEWNFQEIKNNLRVHNTDYRLFSGRMFASIHHTGGMIWIWLNSKANQITGISFFPENGFGSEYKLWKRHWWN